MTACLVAGCTRTHEARGYCAKHYARFRLWGDTDLHYAHGPREPGPLVCTCPCPAPTGTDQCDRCKRVIANLIHQRRAQRQL